MRFLASLGISGILIASPVFADNISVLRQDLKSKEPRLVSSAIEKLGKRADDEAVRILIGFIEGPAENWKIQIRAINLLAEIGNPIAVDILISVMNDPFLTNDCPALRWNAVRALGRFGKEKRVVSALLYRLADKRDLYVREAVIQSLGEAGDLSALPSIAPFLDDKSFALRLSSLKAIGRIGGAGVIPLLEELSQKDKEPVIRQEASNLLKEIRGSG
ncbi:MAG: HEAT repeat domain-containing protein [Nitrospirales bacterium]|nr:HEAT repeat domain-containing protein [Nitrospirales bacterium]